MSISEDKLELLVQLMFNHLSVSLVLLGVVLKALFLCRSIYRSISHSTWFGESPGKYPYNQSFGRSCQQIAGQMPQ